MNRGENSFDLVYILSMFHEGLKHNLQDQIGILTVVSICVQGQSRLKIRNWDLLWTCFDTRNAIAASEFWKEPPLEIVFFEVSHLSRFSWNFYNLLSMALFWKPSIPLDSYWRVGSGYGVNSLIWQMNENLTFWTILPLGTRMWNWSSRAAVNARRALLGSYKR